MSLESEDQSAGSARSAMLDSQLEHREQLLNDYTVLRFRMQSARYKLEPDMLQDMISVRDGLVQAGDTVLIGRLSSRLSVFMQQIEKLLDQGERDAGDAIELAAPVDGWTGSATSAHSAHSGSKRRRVGESCSPTIDGNDARIVQPSGKRARHVGDCAEEALEGAASAKRPKKKQWIAPFDLDRQFFSAYIFQRMLTEDPPPFRFGCARLSGGWKKEPLIASYEQQFPERGTPRWYFSNGQLPGGLQNFWSQAEKIREQLAEYSTESTPERRTRLQGLIRHAAGLPAEVVLPLPQLDVQVRFA